MKEELLIKNLTSDLKPIKPTMAPYKRYLLWCFCYLILVLPLFYYFGAFRPEITKDLLSPFFLLETLLVFFCFLVGGFVCFELLVPGSNKKFLTKLSFLSAGLFLGFALIQVYSPVFKAHSNMMRPTCTFEILGYSFVGLFLFAFFVKNSFPVERRSLVALSGIACSILPVGLMQLGCMYSPHHNLFHHIFPMGLSTLVACGVIFFLLKQYLPKNR